jgi:hypothetical protein
MRRFSLRAPRLRVKRFLKIEPYSVLHGGTIPFMRA